jgi:hypothetical protein
MSEISLRISAGRAYSQVGRLERALRALKGRRSLTGSGKRYTQGIRDVIARSVALHVAQTQETLLEQTPYWSGYLVSNWGLAQGRDPAGRIINRDDKWAQTDVVVSPQGDEYTFPSRGQYDPPRPIDLDQIDGTKYQVLFNNTGYARYVAEGYGPGGDGDRPIKSGGGPDWFLFTGAMFEDIGNYKANFKRALKDVAL